MAKASSMGDPTSTANHVKLNFRNFRRFRKVEKISDLYKFQKKLGEGAFGAVNEAWHVKAEVPCAIKTISKLKLIRFVFSSSFVQLCREFICLFCH